MRIAPWFQEVMDDMKRQGYELHGVRVGDITIERGRRVKRVECREVKAKLLPEAKKENPHEKEKKIFV